MASPAPSFGGGSSPMRALQDADGFIYAAVPELEADVGAAPDDDNLRDVVATLMRGGAAAALAPPPMASRAAPGKADAPPAAGQHHHHGGGPRTEQLPSVADDFIRNFLIRTGMHRALDCFNSEWYELKMKGRLPGDDARAVPDVYAQNQRLEEASALLRVELAQATEVAAKAQSTWDRFRRERDFHRMHHKRVVHEKNRLIVDIKRLKAHYEQFEPTIEELKVKYELAMKEKMLMRLEKDRMAARVEALETQVRQQGGVVTGAGAAGESTVGPRGSAAAGGGGGVGGLPSTMGALPNHPLLRTGLQAPTASSRARVEERFTTGPLPNIQAKALAAAAAEAQALARATRVPDTKLPAEDAPNPYLGLQFDPARAAGYRLTGTVKAHGASVSALSFHPTRPIFASTSDDCLWRVWAVQSAHNAELLMNGEGHRTWLSGVDFHPQGDRLATCSGDGVVKLWSLTSNACTATFSEHLQTCWGVAFHHGGDFLASASMDHTVKLWDVHTGRVRQSMRGHEDSVNAVVFQPFSVNLATASGDKSVSVWDARSGQCIQTFFGHKNAVNGLCFSSRGDTIASCDADGSVKLFDVRMVRERASLSLGRQPVHGVAFDRSAQVLACACDDGVVRVLDSSGAGLSASVSLRGHEDSVQAVAFDPSSQFLLSAGADASVRIWSEGAIKGGVAALASPGGAGGGPDGDDA